MIRITKPNTIPEILRLKGAISNTENIAVFDQNQAGNTVSTAKFNFDTKIYGNPKVKKILKKAQYGKCCFCEKEQKDEYGAVEHFRPKNGYRVAKGSPLLKPGYYWLGYSWLNLFFVCSVCNGSKGTLFPISNEPMRVRNHHGDIETEAPLLLNPMGPEDPRKHIVFEDDVAVGITVQGKETIAVCNLNRIAIQEERKARLEMICICIQCMLKINDKNDQDYKNAVKFLKKSMEKEACFSAAVSDYIKKSKISLS